MPLSGAERSRRWRQRHPDRARDQKYQQRYGITLAEFNALLTAQGGRCAICGKARRLVVDHCHESGEVRGLLCRNCNVGLGHFKDDFTTMLSALQYLWADAKKG